MLFLNLPDLQKHVMFLNHLNLDQLQGLLEETYNGAKDTCYYFQQSTIKPWCRWTDIGSSALDCCRTQILRPCSAAFFIRLRYHAMRRVTEIMADDSWLEEKIEEQEVIRRLEV